MVIRTSFPGLTCWTGQKGIQVFSIRCIWDPNSVWRNLNRLFGQASDSWIIRLLPSQSPGVFPQLIMSSLVLLGFAGGSACKESARNAEDLGSIPGLGKSPGERKGYPLQYAGLDNFMDCIAHGVAKSQTQLSDFH